jgi:hypothetical protein
VTQDTGGMADLRHRLPGRPEGLDPLDEVFGQVPHRAVADRRRYHSPSVFHAFEAHRLIKPALLVLLEAPGDIDLKLGSWLLGSSGGRPPLGDAKVICAPTSLLKFIVGRGQFFLPEPGLAAGVAELVVRG